MRLALQDFERRADALISDTSFGDLSEEKANGPGGRRIMEEDTDPSMPWAHSLGRLECPVSTNLGVAVMGTLVQKRNLPFSSSSSKI